MELNESFEQLLLESENERSDKENDPPEGTCILPAESDDFDESEEDRQEDSSSIWSDHIKEVEQWEFNGPFGVINDRVEFCEHPIDYYSLFMDEIWTTLQEETNRYAKQKEYRTWEHDTDVAELKRFFGLCLQMSIVRLPTLRNYWSKDPIFGGNAIGSQTIKRDRFEAIFNNLHLADNTKNDGTDRIFKIRPLIETFNKLNSEIYRPPQKVCIDESLVPFRGRLFFRQYIPNKRHRYGIKLFKICAEGGHTFKISVYAGKDLTRAGSVADFVVKDLMNNLLNNNRILYCDNWYSSVPLAEFLLERRTHFVGTCKKNRKYLPKEVTHKQLKTGEIKAQQNKNGVMILHWKDKRDVFLMSTKHDASVAPSGKPIVVEDYNQAKIFVDLSDQMASYCPFVRRTRTLHKQFLSIHGESIVINIKK